jgi:hypothetical protein
MLWGVFKVLNRFIQPIAGTYLLPLTDENSFDLEKWVAVSSPGLPGGEKLIG